MSRVVYLDLDGTLLGPGGDLLAGPDGAFSDAGVRALGLLRRAGVPYVLVSGRPVGQLGEAARLLGAAGALAELGALDAGFPTREGETVFEAVAATGAPAALLAREGGLREHPAQVGRREASHCFLGWVTPGAVAAVAKASGGALRLVDNGAAGRDGDRIYHLVPTGAGKAGAVARDLAARGADPSASLAVGDSAEDLEIAAVVGRMVLVGNTLIRHEEALRARGASLARGAYGEGVLEAVVDWLEGR